MISFAENATPAPSAPCPFSDADALEELAEEICTLAAHIHAATYRMLRLIADFDARRGWELDGQRSCAHWLAFRTGIDLGAAREKVRTARVLEGLPVIGAAMGRGELSFSQVRALTRVATPDNEADLLELGRGCTTAQIERLVRAWRWGAATEAERAEARHESRSFSVRPDVDGMYVVRGRLEPEVGALLMRAVEAASDALYREEEAPADPACRTDASHRADLTHRQAARRRADAVGLLAERAMSAGFGATDDDDSDVAAPVSGTRAERYQVVLHVEEEGLGEEEGAHLSDGTRVSAETSRRLSCDAAKVVMTHGPAAGGGEAEALARRRPILHVGRRTRTIPPALRRALEYRDRGCRFPGCGLRFTDAHHVKHWAEGGETSLGNCLLLCRHHHRLLHEGGWRVELDAESGEAVFYDPRGHMCYDGRWRAGEPAAPTAAAPGSGHPDPVHQLLAQHHDLGINPDGWTPGARWKHIEDIPTEILSPAIEAILEGDAA